MFYSSKLGTSQENLNTYASNGSTMTGVFVSSNKRLHVSRALLYGLTKIRSGFMV